MQYVTKCRDSVQSNNSNQSRREITCLIQIFLPEVVARLATRKFQFPTEKYEALEGERKAIQTETEELQARRNQVAKKIGAAKKAGGDATELLKEGAAIAEGLAALEGKNAAVKKALNDLLLTIPNLPDPSVPVGKDETENVEVRRWGTVEGPALGHTSRIRF